MYVKKEEKKVRDGKGKRGDRGRGKEEREEYENKVKGSEGKRAG